MGGFFGVASHEDCVFDLLFGIDYHSHLGTRRGGMTVYGEKGFNRAIHNIENAPFRTKFDKHVQEMEGKYGIGCISDYEPQPLIIRSHHGTYAITTVGKINNMDELIQMLFDQGHAHFQEMSTGEVNATVLVAALITGTLAARLKDSAQESAQAASRTKVLFDTNQLLQKARSEDEVIRVIANQVLLLLERNVVIYPVEEERLGNGYVFTKEGYGKDTVFLEGSEKKIAEWVMVNKKKAGASTKMFPEGKALYLGVSRWPLKALEFADKYLREHDCPLLVYQGKLNLLSRDPQKEGITSYCADHGIGFVSFSPLAQGLLTDRYLNGIPADSRMAKEHFLTHEALTPQLLAQLKQWNGMAAERGESLAEMALSWILQQQAVTSVLVGASSTAQLATNLKGVDATCPAI